MSFFFGGGLGHTPQHRAERDQFIRLLQEYQVMSNIGTMDMVYVSRDRWTSIKKNSIIGTRIMMHRNQASLLTVRENQITASLHDNVYSAPT